MKKIIRISFLAALMIGPIQSVLADMDDAPPQNSFQTRITTPSSSPHEPAAYVNDHYTPAEQEQFKTRHLRERTLQHEEWASQQRAQYPARNNRVVIINDKTRAFEDNERYHRQLRVREWSSSVQRDAELRYLLWREEQLSRYFWRHQGRICRYVTVYKTGVRINKHVTVCDRSLGRYHCYYPKRYFIYPVTRLVCYRMNDPRVRGGIIREYSY